MATVRGSSYRIFEPEIWSDYVRYFFKVGMAGAKHFADFSGDCVGGGERIHIPYINAGPTPSSVVTSTGDLTDNVVSDTKTVLTIDTWVATSYRFTDYQMKQIAAKYNIIAKYVEQASYGLGKKVDYDLLNAAKSALQRRVNDSATGITATDLRSAMNIVDSYNIPREGLLMIMNSKTYWSLMRNNILYDASIFGRGAQLASGVTDYIYGVPTFISNNLPTWGVASEMTLLAHKNAVAYAIMGAPRIQLKDTDDLAKRLIADVMYGKNTMDAYAGVRILSRASA